MKSYALLAAGVLALLGAAGCSRSDGGKPATATAAAPVEKRYPLTGEVIRVDAANKVLVVQHDEIKDFMPAMTILR